LFRGTLRDTRSYSSNENAMRWRESTSAQSRLAACRVVSDLTEMAGLSLGQITPSTLQTFWPLAKEILSNKDQVRCCIRQLRISRVRITDVTDYWHLSACGGCGSPRPEPGPGPPTFNAFSRRVLLVSTACGLFPEHCGDLLHRSTSRTNVLTSICCTAREIYFLIAFPTPAPADMRKPLGHEMYYYNAAPIPSC
jgi:hypothetical protein